MKPCPVCHSHPKPVIWTLKHAPWMQYAYRCSNPNCPDFHKTMTEFFDTSSQARQAWRRLCDTYKEN